MPQLRPPQPLEARFCLNCGARLAVVCPACQRQLSPDARFCSQCGASLEPSRWRPFGNAAQPAPTMPESFVASRYQVKRFLGEGGKKKVYLVYDTLLDRDVAFSLIKTEGLDEVGITRIKQEAQLRPPRRPCTWSASMTSATRGPALLVGQ